MDVACPGNAACYLPFTKNVKYYFSGVDDIPGPGTSWKDEFRRALGYVEGIPTFSDWETQEVFTLAEANLWIRRADSGICVTPSCENVPDFVSFAEPIGTVLTENLIGFYRRPTNANDKRWINVDIDKLDQTPQFQFNDSRRHFMLEHLSRWAVNSYAGIGAYSFDSSRMPPQTDGEYEDDVMQSTSEHNASTSKYNYNNNPQPWEQCMLSNYSLVHGSSTSYTVWNQGCL